MATFNQLAANSQTQSDKHTPTTVVVTTKRKVTYMLDTSVSSSSLKMPYAVAINGKIHSDFKAKPLQVSGNKGKIAVTVNSGDKVELYLNSDAHPDYRTQPVYAITPSDNDVVVRITEKEGKHADADTPTQKSRAAEAGKPDEYTAPLTGDIWLRVSHKYTTGEASKLIPSATAPEIKAGILKYYDGSLTRANGNIKIVLPAKDGKPSRTVEIAVGAGADTNPLKHIQSFELFRDGLPRVHPHGYLALVEAAFDAGIEKVTLTSTWRPMVGSIAHRAGLGLDVNHLDDTRLNREELRKTKAADTDNVSEEEKKRFKEKEAAEAEAIKAKAELEKLRKEHEALLTLKKTNPNKASPIREVELEREIEIAKNKAKDASENATQSNNAWNEERNKNEPDKLKGFRATLSRHEHVKQLFDPWFMDNNTKDQIPAAPNEQKTSNEILHSHHLHITVHESGILEG